MQTAMFDYDLPPSSIAQDAIEPRHSSRLLVAADLSDMRFRLIGELLGSGDLVVVNRTRVRAARLVGIREGTGGRSEVLLTKRIDSQSWQAMLKPAKRMPVGTIVECGAITIEVLTQQSEGVATVALSSYKDIEEALDEAGEVPLPPYFHGSLPSDDRYQTMFAKTIGSAAAPTAALHFTPEVVADLDARGVEIAEVELQVGLDTFRPMGEGRVEDHVIHREQIVVDQHAVDAVDRARSSGGRVVAVGTTVVRALETAATGDGRITATDRQADLFIVPGYRFSVVDAMVTNFHAPQTTLIVMIAAALGERWRDVYEYAVESGFRFLSFGDAMFIEDLR